MGQGSGRVTYDVHTGRVLEDVNPKGEHLYDMTGPIPGSRPGRGRDIITEFHFRRGAWEPASATVLAGEAGVSVAPTMPGASAEPSRSNAVRQGEITFP